MVKDCDRGLENTARNFPEFWSWNDLNDLHNYDGQRDGLVGYSHVENDVIDGSSYLLVLVNDNMNKDISEKRNQESAVISQAWSELLESVWFVVCELFSKKCLTVVLTVIISLDTRQSTSELSEVYTPMKSRIASNLQVYL